MLRHAKKRLRNDTEDLTLKYNSYGNGHSLTHTHFACTGTPRGGRTNEQKWTRVKKVTNSNVLTVLCKGDISITDRSKPLPRRQTEWTGDPVASAKVSGEEEETATTAAHDSDQRNEEGRTWTRHLQQLQRGPIWSQDRPGRPACKGKIHHASSIHSLLPRFPSC